MNGVGALVPGINEIICIDWDDWIPAASNGTILKLPAGPRSSNGRIPPRPRYSWMRPITESERLFHPPPVPFGNWKNGRDGIRVDSIRFCCLALTLALISLQNQETAFGRWHEASWFCVCVMIMSIAVAVICHPVQCWLLIPFGALHRRTAYCSPSWRSAILRELWRANVDPAVLADLDRASLGFPTLCNANATEPTFLHYNNHIKKGNDGDNCIHGLSILSRRGSKILGTVDQLLTVSLWLPRWRKSGSEIGCQSDNALKVGPPGKILPPSTNLLGSTPSYPYNRSLLRDKTTQQSTSCIGY